MLLASIDRVLANSNLAIDLINQERIKRGLRKIEIDENLCVLAKMLAEDREAAYPKDINESLFTNSRYKPYIKDYLKYVISSLTVNDILVKFYKEKGINVPLFTDEQIAQQSIVDGQALTPEITNGCSAVSSGSIGYKPYAYFIGGVKKISAPNVVNNSTQNMSLFRRIRLFFTSLLSKIHSLGNKRED